MLSKLMTICLLWHALGVHSEATRLKIKGGKFLMGDGTSTKGPIQGSLPQQTVEVSDFEIDATTASNAEFEKFVSETKFQTDSEKFGWSFVLDSHMTAEAAEQASGQVKGAEHWIAVPEASWKYPRGPNSFTMDNHPVVHISYTDAAAYCEWKGGRLPTETEWEYAARAGLTEKQYPWGDAAIAVQGDGRLKKWKANVWQGKFPKKDEAEDGFSGTCPVDKYEPNAFGLYNTVGNVWEWTSTKGPLGEKGVVSRVLRGASFVDSVDGSFNHKANINSRMSNSEDSASSNTGVRCAYGPVSKKGYRYPKEKPRLDQDILSKIAEDGGIDALQEYLGDSAKVMTAKDLKEQKDRLEKMKEQMKEEL